MVIFIVYEIRAHTYKVILKYNNIMLTKIPEFIIYYICNNKHWEGEYYYSVQLYKFVDDINSSAVSVINYNILSLIYARSEFNTTHGEFNSIPTLKVFNF